MSTGPPPFSCPSGTSHPEGPIRRRYVQPNRAGGS
uniref:Uncharacterized protein n=1 Tax=Siphoviridae sp. ctvok7 TaxID=2827596 RepID=A0A8S5LLR5_9CAUD|nr:MAG TPA: hypothetical protein [Siphoviridae sp. ctvok7]